MNLLKVAALTAALLTGCQPAEAPEAREPGLEGAWSIVSIRVTGPDSAASPTVQPSVYLFGDTHYSMMRVTGNQPLAAYDPFIANAWAYKVADSTITIHPSFSRSPNFMSGGSDKYYFRISGDTLWLSNTGADFKTMIGGQLVTPPGAPSATMLILVRQR